MADAIDKVALTGLPRSIFIVLGCHMDVIESCSIEILDLAVPMWSRYLLEFVFERFMNTISNHEDCCQDVLRQVCWRSSSNKGNLITKPVEGFFQVLQGYSHISLFHSLVV